MIFILVKLCNLILRSIKVLAIIIVATIIILIAINIKFKPAYAVVYNEKVVGYVYNKDNFQQKINNEILKSNDESVAFVSLDNVSYNLQYVAKNIINEDTVIENLKSNAKKIYKVYEVYDTTDESTAIYVNSEKEANNLIDTLKSDYSKVTDNLAITVLYLEEPVSEESIANAKASINSKLTEEQETKVAEEEEIKSHTVNGIYLACLPVSTGHVSSRFGSRESIRDHVHKGLDIAASYGTDIKAVADGTVIFSGVSSGYGNFIKIDHGNNVVTCYGHCSKLLVSVGQEIKAGDVIAKVGSTGNSTGNHLHFEIRINDVQVNPEKYLYN